MQWYLMVHLMTNEDEQLFMFIGHLDIHLDEVPIQISCSFLYWV